MLTPSQEAALDLSDRFSFALMQKHRDSIQFAINTFRSLDVMMSKEDLEQEAYFGLSTALRSWKEARAIHMKFETFLVWHIKRHLQGIFLNSDMVVELIDPGTSKVVITLPYERYRKIGRRMARQLKYQTRIRSLKVYYEEDVALTGSEPTAVDPHHHSAVSTMADTRDTYVVDLYSPDGVPIITIPRSLYLKKFQLIQGKRLGAHERCLYDSTEHAAPPRTCAPPTFHRRVQRPCRKEKLESLVVDIYTRQGDKFLRTTPSEYEAHRAEFRGYLIHYHDVTIHPEQPDYEEVERSAPSAHPPATSPGTTIRILKAVRQKEYLNVPSTTTA